MERTGEQRKAAIGREEPDLAAELGEVVIDPPDRTFAGATTIEVGGRQLELEYVGRGHTDHDILITVPGADVLFAGDLVEQGNVPFFGDGYPLDWVATARAVAERVTGTIVPGHGNHAGRAFAEDQAASMERLVALARDVQAGTATLDDAIAAHPFPELPPDHARSAFERTLTQLRGDLD
jgi:glyoxylase-like metal-dependent hydrolase (beta-lactamase superfamily II)